MTGPTAPAAGLLPGVSAQVVRTGRLATHLLAAGDADGVPVVFLHGNVSTSRFWEETLAALPPGYRGVAPDLRGFGGSEGLPVDATRGLRDFADDLHALLAALLAARPGTAGGVHLVGWSMGGGVALQYAIDHPTAVHSIVLVNPLSPVGFGGTKDASGTLCWPDAAGSGGGTANPEFVRRLAEGDRGEDSDFSPRRVMNTYYVKPPFRADPGREECYVDALLACRIGDENYPGASVPSDHWPGVAPSPRGVNNAMAPTYCDLRGFAEIHPQPDVLWVRGLDDQIVSDTSLFDLGYLGQLGAVPGWPGPQVYPPQPMVSQTRAVLDAYAAHGGRYREEPLADCGHSPHLEQPDRFRALLADFLAGR